MSIINKKVIAKNTFFLYVRLLLILCISLFTVRIVLDALGEVDYGINNVVAGVVTMFSFLSSTMSGASQRFFSFELGRNDHEKLHKIFCINRTLYFIIALIVLLLAETVGLWFLRAKLNIPVERTNAALWIYRFAVLSFIITIISIPYNAIIIAREKMNIYAYVSIIEVLLKLGCVYLLYLYGGDKLILYGLLLCITTLLTSSFYIIYCKKNFSECAYGFQNDRGIFKELVSYAGWNLFGSMASICKSQGINILLNIFFGPVVNAARAVAYQVLGAVNQFVSNFFTAVRPQIVKAYSVDEKKEMMDLFYQSTKFSYFLILLLSMPLLLETPAILSLWLKDVPAHTVIFTRLVLINAIIDTFSYPVIASVQATGKVKYYQIIIGSLLLFILPLSYLFLKMGFAPESTMIISIVVSVVAQAIRLVFMKKMFCFSLRQYFKEVLLSSLSVTLLSFILPVVVIYYVHVGTVARLALTCVVSVLSTLLVIYVVGLSRKEKDIIKDYIHRKIKSKTC